MNSLKTFDFNGKSVRIILRDGEPWWVAKDVADILDYSGTDRLTKRLDTDEFISAKLEGMNMHSILINESGLYNAILGSQKPEAKSFKKWVTGTVLPSIRKTGSYTVSQPSYQIDDPIARAERWIQETKAHQQLLLEKQEELNRAETTIQAQEHLVELANDLIVADVLYSFQQAGGMLGYGRNNLFDVLRAYNIIQPRSTMPYRQYIDAGYFEIKALTIKGIKTNKTQTFITPRGLQWLNKKLKKKRIKKAPLDEGIDLDYMLSTTSVVTGMQSSYYSISTTVTSNNIKKSIDPILENFLNDIL